MKRSRDVPYRSLKVHAPKVIADEQDASEPEGAQRATNRLGAPKAESDGPTNAHSRLAELFDDLLRRQALATGLPDARDAATAPIDTYP